MTDRVEQIGDELLVLRSQGGDADAFDELVRRWHGRLWKHAFRLTGSSDAAADVAQETWAGVIRGLPELRIPATFPGWAYRIATNKARDWIRKQTRDRKLEGTLADRERREHVNAVPSGGSDILDRALQGLPGESRALLDLYYVQGFDIREVAEILSVASGTVKSRLARAREALRLRMEELKDAER